MVSGWLIGLVYKDIYSLIEFIRSMDRDEEELCEGCSERDTCRAWKPIGTSNWVTEFTGTSYLLIQKVCRYTQKRSYVYTLICAVLNGVLYAGIYLRYGITVRSVLYCLCTTVLIYVAAVDWKTQYIPVECNILIFIFGLIRLALSPELWLEQIIGLLSVSLILCLVDLIGRKITGGSVMGGGDIKLMAAAGFLLGWKLNIVAFMMGCVLGSVIHLSIMKIGKGEHRLAFGPYLSMGIYIAMICGEQLMSWYLGIVGL